MPPKRSLGVMAGDVKNKASQLKSAVLLRMKAKSVETSSPSAAPCSTALAASLKRRIRRVLERRAKKTCAMYCPANSANLVNMSLKRMDCALTQLIHMTCEGRMQLMRPVRNCQFRS